MSVKRRYWFSKKYEIKDVEGHLVTMAVFRDLSDEDLKKQYRYFIERDDFEYLYELKAEADMRGISLIKKMH